MKLVSRDGKRIEERKRVYTLKHSKKRVKINRRKEKENKNGESREMRKGKIQKISKEEGGN